MIRGSFVGCEDLPIGYQQCHDVHEHDQAVAHCLELARDEQEQDGQLYGADKIDQCVPCIESIEGAEDRLERFGSYEFLHGPDHHEEEQPDAQRGKAFLSRGCHERFFLDVE